MKGTKPPEILTPRLRLSAIRPTDKEDLIRLLTDEELTRTYMVPDLPTDEQRTALFERFISISSSDHRFMYGIRLADRLIGVIHEVSVTQDEIELGYFISPAKKNRGYATEALAAVLPVLFGLGYAAIRAGAFTENPASLRVMEKCGMTPTGETESISYRGKEHLCVYRAIRRENHI